MELKWHALLSAHTCADKSDRVHRSVETSPLIRSTPHTLKANSAWALTLALPARCQGASAAVELSVSVRSTGGSAVAAAAAAGADLAAGFVDSAARCRVQSAHFVARPISCKNQSNTGGPVCRCLPCQGCSFQRAEHSPEHYNKLLKPTLVVASDWQRNTALMMMLHLSGCSQSCFLSAARSAF